MLPRPVGSLLVLLGAATLPSAHAYTCTAAGTECTAANRIYGSGVYTDRSTLEAACHANAACIQYDWSSTDSVGFQCSSTATRDDQHDEYVVCVKPESPKPPPSPPQDVFSTNGFVQEGKVRHIRLMDDSPPLIRSNGTQIRKI